VLGTSSHLTTGNFTRFSPYDLQALFDEYDRRFFGGQCRVNLGGHSPDPALPADPDARLGFIEIADAK
jgi:hypothetical protein